MSGGANVSSNPIGEVRPRPHNFITKQARSGFARPKERCGASSVTITGLRGLPNAPNRGILATQLSPSGESLLTGLADQQYLAH